MERCAIGVVSVAVLRKPTRDVILRELAFQFVPAKKFCGGREAARGDPDCSRRFHSRSAAERIGSRFIQTTIAIVDQRENDVRARAHQGNQKFPAGKGLAGVRQSQIRASAASASWRSRERDRGYSVSGSSVAARDLQHGALRFDVEAADGFDLVAEELDAHGLRRFRRKHVEDAAANRIFAHHFDRLAALVADAFEVRNHIFERHLFAGAQRERELPVEIGGFGAQQRGRNGHDGDRDLLSGQTPQADGALLADFGVRRRFWCGSTSSAGISCGDGQIAASKQQIEENVSIDSSSVSACLLPSTRSTRRPFGRLLQQDKVERFGGGGEAGNGERAALAAVKELQQCFERPVPGGGSERDLEWRDESRRVAAARVILSAMSVVE